MLEPYREIVLISIILLSWAIVTLWRNCEVQLNLFTKEATLPLRAILAIFVVFHHVAIFRPFQLGTQAVSVFFFISGYGMVKSYQHKGDRYLSGFCSKYAIKLFVPFLICLVPWMIRNIFVDIFGIGGGYDWCRLIARLKNGQIWGLLPNSWYIFVLFYFGIFFSFAYRINHKIVRLIVLFALVLIYQLIAIKQEWGYARTASTFAFPFGCMYAECEEKVLWLIKRFKWVYAVGVLFVYIGCKFLHSPIAHYMIGYIIVTILYLHPLPRWKWLMWLGAISYEIYLVHGCIYWTLCGSNGKYLTAFITLAVTPLMAYFVHKISGKVSDRILATCKGWEPVKAL